MLGQFPYMDSNLKGCENIAKNTLSNVAMKIRFVLTFHNFLMK